jgi:hypothetical protein
MLWQRGRTYSQDLRERVFAEVDDGEAAGERVLRVEGSEPAAPHWRDDGPATAVPTAAEARSVLRRHPRSRPSASCGVGYSRRTTSRPATA